MKINLPLLTLGATLFLAGAGTAVSQITNAITINNYSFENPVVADGSYTLSTTGWSTSGSAAAFAIINPGTGNWPSATPAGMDGANAGQIFMTSVGQSGIFYQDTGVKYAAGVTYQLTAAIGLQSGQIFDTNSALVFYNSSLTAISTNAITPAKLTAGAFTNLTLTYTATGTEGGNGDVVVGFYAPPTAVVNSYFDFDNVRLVAISPNLPLIVTQPVSQTALAGNPVSFSVGALGNAPLSYQWQATNNVNGFTNLVNGGQVSGANTNVLTIANVTASWPSAYRVIVTNVNGAVTSSPAGLVVKSSVLVDVDIGSAVNVQTGPAVLGAAGDAWNGVTVSTGTIADSTGATVSGVGYAVAGYTGFNDQPGGSPHAVMDVATTPLMRDCVYGQNATLTVSLTGLNAYLNDAFTLVVYGSVGDPNQGDNLTLAGAAGGNAAATLTTTGASRQISAGNGVAYQTFTGMLTNGTLTITCANNGNIYGGVNGFQLLFTPLPIIAAQPVSQTNAAGASASFSVSAFGTPPLSYRWQATNSAAGGFTNLADGGQITGSLSNVLTIANLTTNSAGAYQVIVSNNGGSVTSSPASLTVLTFPVITTQPASQTNFAGGTVSFNAAARGGGALDLPMAGQQRDGFHQSGEWGPGFGSQLQCPFDRRHGRQLGSGLSGDYRQQLWFRH